MKITAYTRSMFIASLLYLLKIDNTDLIIIQAIILELKIVILHFSEFLYLLKINAWTF